MYATSIRALPSSTAEKRGDAGLYVAKGRRTSGSASGRRELDLMDLSEHLDRCRRSSGPLFKTLCLTDTIDKFLAPRMVTTLVVIALLSGAAFALL